MKYDLIGDIHGHADALLTLLDRLGYEYRSGAYRHPERTGLFLGDFIDRGPAIRETLGIVRPMVESGAALSVMGNHEYNALCFARKRSEKGDWLRSRNDRHLYQHIETLYQFRNHREEWGAYLDWFMELPLYLDLGNIRAVHAAWDPGSIECVSRFSAEGNKLTEDLLYRSASRKNPEFDAVGSLLKGVEIELPSEKVFIDKDGNRRKEMRVRWWNDPRNASYREMAMPTRAAIADMKLTAEDEAIIPGYEDNVPVFIGHYWLEEPHPAILAPHIACLDYSVAKGGYLAAYRWNGERELRNDSFVTSGRRPPCED